MIVRCVRGFEFEQIARGGGLVPGNLVCKVNRSSNSNFAIKGSRAVSAAICNGEHVVRARVLELENADIRVKHKQGVYGQICQRRRFIHNEIASYGSDITGCAKVHVAGRINYAKEICTSIV